MTFSFMVNWSFLGYCTHPITVPRSQVDHAALQKLVSDNPQVLVRAPNGAYSKGKLYSGLSSWGPYHQVRVDSLEVAWEHGLEFHERVTIVLKRVGKVLVVDIRNVAAKVLAA